MQSLLSAAYIMGYRVGMLVSGFGALELAGILDPYAVVPERDWALPYAAVGGFGLLEQGVVYDYASWRLTYLAMVGVMAVGVVTTLSVREPERPVAERPYTTGQYLRFLGSFLLAAVTFFGLFLSSDELVGQLKGWLVFAGEPVLAGFLAEAVRFLLALAAALSVGWLTVSTGLTPRQMAIHSYVSPFVDFFRRYGRAAVWILALIALYRVSDVMLGVIANVFYTDIGFEKQEIGRMSKAFGLVMTIVGGFLGGILTERWGVMWVLFLGGLLAAGTNLLFSLLAWAGDVLWLLGGVIAADNLSAGIATTAFIAFLSGLTNREFTASQYAVFSSLMLLLPKLLGGYSGGVVDTVGYPAFFVLTACVGVPVLFLVWRVARLQSR
jgi:PAT family beta-lactamase induction signal transducer AmpG